MQLDRCAYCRFSAPADDKGEGFICHRFPPMPQLVPQHNALTGESGMAVQAFHPPVGPDNWCGEFVRASDEPDSSRAGNVVPLHD